MPLDHVAKRAHRSTRNKRGRHALHGDSLGAAIRAALGLRTVGMRGSGRHAPRFDGVS